MAKSLCYFSFCFLYLYFTFLNKTVLSELRFCYKGPHTIRESVCPGGFIAFQPLNFSCLYYKKGPDVPDTMVRVQANVCNPNSKEVFLNQDGEDDPMPLEEFNRVLFESFNEPGGSISGSEMPENICADAACLAEWRKLDEPDDEPMLLEKPQIPDKVEMYQKRYLSLAKEVITELTRAEDLDEEGHEKPEEELLGTLMERRILDADTKVFNILQLLAETIKITSTKCAPFVEREYMNQVMKGMIILNQKDGTHSNVEIDPVSFKRILKHLKSCERSANHVFRLNGTECGEVNTLDTIVGLTHGETLWRYRRQARSFRWGYYDPLIESAWAAVDFVHGYCFQAFHAAEDILHFHLYMSAMEALFPPEPVQTHWMFPAKLKKDNEFWNTIMDTEDIKNQLRSLDGCATAAYLAKSPFQERLLRPFVREEQMEDPQYETYPDGKKGWEKSSSEYWIWYEKQGGFKEISKNLGYCLDGSIENLEAVEAELKEKGLQSCEQT